MIINSGCILILTNNQVSVGSHRQIIAKIKLIVGNTLKKERYLIRLTGGTERKSEDLPKPSLTATC